MGKIYYVMGKSASGKDTVFNKILERIPELNKIILYTTRPMREGEQEGVEYYFTTHEIMERFRNSGKLIEERTYQTVYGPWSYFTIDDGQIDLEHQDYLMSGTLEAYMRVQKYFGGGKVIPIYIQVDDGIRLQRALDRERKQRKPKYTELCRRFLADEEDFKEEYLKQCGIDKRYHNFTLETCVDDICRDIVV